MEQIWVYAFITLLGLGVYSFTVYIERRTEQHLSAEAAAYEPSDLHRAIYWTFTAFFVAAPFVAMFVVQARFPLELWDPLWMLATGAGWFLLGLLPIAVAAAQGRKALHTFRLSLEKQSKATFRTQLWIWFLAISVVVLLGFGDLR